MKKNMKENFELLERRLIDSLYYSDIDRINYELSKISGPTLVSGVGGSSVVSDYASKILSAITSHILSGWPMVTDSLVIKFFILPPSSY